MSTIAVVTRRGRDVADLAAPRPAGAVAGRTWGPWPTVGLAVAAGAAGILLPGRGPFAAVVPAVLSTMLVRWWLSTRDGSARTTGVVGPPASAALVLGAQLAAAPVADVVPAVVAALVAAFVARVTRGHVGAVFAAVVVWWLVSW